MNGIGEEYVNVTVEAVDDGGGTVALARGHTDDGRPVTFVGEPRMLAAIADAIEAGEEPVAAVPTWAMLA